MSDEATHRILVRAKEYLLNHGWCAYGYGPASDGAPRCLVGSLKEGANLKARQPWTAVALRAYDSVKNQMPGRDAPANWNDTEGRTFDEVIAALDQAILATAPKDTPAPQPETLSPLVTRVFA